MNFKSTAILKKLENKKNFHFYFKIMTVFFLISLLFSCGKKGPPVPPDMLPLLPVTDLEAKLFDNVLELSWTAQTGKGRPAPDGFRIYRSKKSLVDSECPECPGIFEKVAEMAMAFRLWGWQERRIDYHETLEDGYIYHYKVMTYTHRGLTSEWSNTVEIEVKSELSLR
jgi:hypothetical protein